MFRMLVPFTIGLWFNAFVYVLVLLVHFGWAVHILRTGKTSLAVGPIQTPGPILLGLLALNLPSIVVFIPATGFATKTAAIGHALYHVLLTGDEILRVGKARVRWVFSRGSCGLGGAAFCYSLRCL